MYLVRRRARFRSRHRKTGSLRRVRRQLRAWCGRLGFVLPRCGADRLPWRSGRGILQAARRATSGPYFTRLIFSTWWPTSSNMRRICRLRPSISVTSYHGLGASLTRRIFAGDVRTRRPSSVAIDRPPRNLFSASSVGRLLTFTTYVLATWDAAFINLWASVPSLVIRTRPSLA